MKVPIVRVFRSSRGDMSHYIFRTQKADIPKTIEEYVNNQTPVGVVHEYNNVFADKDFNNISMNINESPIGYKGFKAFSLPFEFNLPNVSYKIEFKNNVVATDVVSYTIYTGTNVINKVEQSINGEKTVITDLVYIFDNFKIQSNTNAILIKSELCNYSLANFYGKIRTFSFQDDGNSSDPEVVPSRAHGVYTPVLNIIETNKYISLFQNADSRRNIYYYNVVSKTYDGMVSEISNTQVCEIAESPSKIKFTLESSDDYFQVETPSWEIVKVATPIDEIRVNKNELVSKIIPTANFNIYANDEYLKLENMRELKITNLWNSDSRKLMNRDKKVFRAYNKYTGSEIVQSPYSNIISFDDQIEVFIDKIVILKKNVTGLKKDEMTQPIKMTDKNADVIKVFVRQGGIFYKDFFLNDFSTNKNDEYYQYDDDGNKFNIPDYLVSSITLNSRFPLLNIKDSCIYGNKYNYTIYLYDEFGEISSPISIVL